MDNLNIRNEDTEFLSNPPKQTDSAIKTSHAKIAILSLSFLFVFSASTSTSMISERILTSYQTETENSKTPFTGTSGYLVYAFYNAIFLFGNWIAPIIVGYLSLKWSLFIGHLSFALYMVSYIYPNSTFIYANCFILGFGSAIMWVAQGTFMTIYCSPEKLTKFCSFFWTFVRCATVTGNVFVYYQFIGVETITSTERVPLFTIFTGLAVLGGLLVLAIKFDREEVKNKKTLIKRLKKSASLCKSRVLYLAIPLFFLQAFHYPFWTMIFSTCIANSKGVQTDTDKLIGLHGIFCGIGSVLTGLILIIFSSKLSKIKLTIITTLIAVFVYTSAYFQFPTECSLSETDTELDLYLVFITSFSSGVVDTLVMVNILSYVSEKFETDSACAAFSVVHFCSALGATIGYLFAESINFHFQLFFLIFVAVFSCFCFLTANK